MDKRWLTKVILLSAGVIGMALLTLVLPKRQTVQNRAFFGGVSVVLSPSTLTKTVGEEFSVDLKIESGTIKVSGFDFRFNYDSEKLEIINFVKDPQSLLTVEISPPSNGVARIQAFGTGEAPLGSIKVGTVKLKGKIVTGSEPVRLVLNQTQSLIVGVNPAPNATDSNLRIDNATDGAYTFTQGGTQPTNTPTPALCPKPLAPTNASSSTSVKVGETVTLKVNPVSPCGTNKIEYQFRHQMLDGTSIGTICNWGENTMCQFSYNQSGIRQWQARARIGEMVSDWSTLQTINVSPKLTCTSDTDCNNFGCLAATCENEVCVSTANAPSTENKSCETIDPQGIHHPGACKGGFCLPGLTPIPTATPTGTPDGVIKVNFKVKFQGINSKRADQKVSIRVEGEGFNEIYKDINVTANDSGVYSGRLVLDKDANNRQYEPADFVLFIKGPKHLAKKYCKNDQKRRCIGGSGTLEFKAGENNFDFTGDVLEAGDLPNPNDGGKQDGVANSVDYSLASSRWASTAAEDLATADCNLDGIVTGVDTNMIRETIEIRYEDEE